MEIKLGQTVEDEVTGFVGVATSKVEMMTGNVQFSVYPRAKEGEKYPEGRDLDYHLLKVRDERLVDRVIAPKPPRIRLGDTVRDRVSGFTGVAIKRVTFMNGCLYYTVETIAKQGLLKPLDDDFLPEDRLEMVQPETVQVPEVTTRRGGPSARSQGQR